MQHGPKHRLIGTPVVSHTSGFGFARDGRGGLGRGNGGGPDGGAGATAAIAPSTPGSSSDTCGEHAPTAASLASRRNHSLTVNPTATAATRHAAFSSTRDRTCTTTRVMTTPS